MAEDALVGRMRRFDGVMRLPHARVFCSPDLWADVLRLCKPGGVYKLPDGISIVMDQRLKPATVVALAPVNGDQKEAA